MWRGASHLSCPPRAHGIPRLTTRGACGLSHSYSKSHASPPIRAALARQGHPRQPWIASHSLTMRMPMLGWASEGPYRTFCSKGHEDAVQVVRFRVKAPDTPLHAVGFPSLLLEAYPVDHTSPYCGATSRGRQPRSIQLRPPFAGCVRGCHACPAGEAVLRWDVHRNGAHPLGNKNQLHGIAPNAKVSDLPSLAP